MRLKIMTPTCSVLDEDVESVTLPGTDGQLTVLGGHDILASGLKKGRLYFRQTGNQRKDYDIGEGFMEVTKDTARVFVASAQKVLPEVV